MNNKKTIQKMKDWLERFFHPNKQRIQLLEYDLNCTIEQNNVYRETLRKMSLVINTLEMENQSMYTLLQRLRAHGMEIKGELADEFKNAIDDGKRALKAYDHSHLKMRKTHE
jgi:hypothetical protein